jgi:hypothetical protein
MTLGDGPGAGRLGWRGGGGGGGGGRGGGRRRDARDMRGRSGSGTLTLDEGEGHVLDGQQGATLRATQAA